MKGFFKFILLLSINFTVYSCHEKTMFQQLSSLHTGIHFNNLIKETDTLNILDFANLYNGGGVGIGDFNNDGLPDIYFAGNVVSNKLYLNKGNLTFEDVTSNANVTGDGKWCRGISVVDINNDGWLDIYVCATIWKEGKRRENLLYVNQGKQNKGIPKFYEQAAAYGLNDSSYSTNASFFDFDNDGDLDVFISVNEIFDHEFPNKFRKLINDGSFPSTGRLLKNTWSDSQKHPLFTNVSKQAGITYEGYSHGATVVDINKDGWKDIYVTNDYLSPNVLYINNKDGTFTNKSSTYFKHTSANAMGQDITDLNNDGLADVVELDMNPRDNYRKKMMLNPNSYQTYRNLDYFGYQYQYVRNTFQLNQGPRVNENDTIGEPIFSEVSFMANIAETDWSWAPLVADFDNDGFRDIIVTNGFPKDVTDHDFVAFRNQAYTIASKKEMLEQIPVVKIKDYAFHNNGDLSFSDVSPDWGIAQPSFSNGAAYADLDNDGDLDYVVNNINDEAFIYENKQNDTKTHNNYLQINLTAESLNINGIGVFIELFYDNGKQQVYENTPFRGYLSSVQQGAHFGLENISEIDSILIKWPDEKMQVLENAKANQTITVQHKDANQTYTWQQPLLAVGTVFTDVSNTLAPNIIHKEDDYIDFNIQKLLPHKLSDYAPGLSVGDINNDGLDDMVMGGSLGYPAQVIFQQPNGKFIAKDLAPDVTRNNKEGNDMGILLFDADNDGDPDLYISSGGYESPSNSPHYQDNFFLNDGLGNFTADTLALPKNFTSKSCVRATDIDNDGDLDLFVAGRCLPEKYPQPVSCFIYRNDSKKGKISFIDVSKTIAKDLSNVGMTCDALFSDFDNDGWVDLLISGEFMPIKIFHNTHGILNVLPTDLDSQVGWWNSIVPGDYDNDGDIDYIAGNAGKNSFYNPSDQYPVRVYGKDFDNNGSFDAIPSLYLPAQDGSMKEFPAQTRDDLIKQMIEMRNKFKSYNDFATASFDKFLSKDQLMDATILTANNFKSSYIRNDGKGHFTISPLPLQAQISSVYGMLAEDVDGDGNLDVIMTGNDYGIEVSVGRYDAFNGLVLKGDGKGNFQPLSILQSGLYIPGNGKAMVKLSNKSGQCMIAASQNRGPLKVFVMKQQAYIIAAKPNDFYALLNLRNGKIRKEELYYGAGFLSQPARFINIGSEVQSAEMVDSKGVHRKIF